MLILALMGVHLSSRTVGQGEPDQGLVTHPRQG